MTGSGGVLLPAWMDLIGRTIPTTLRGRFFAVSSAASNVGGLAGSAVTASILAAIAAPASYGICFLAAAVWMAFSYLALAAVREPAAPASVEVVPLAEHLRRVPALLRHDRNLTWFLGARALSMLGGMGGVFYTVYAIRGHGAPEWKAGVFTTMLLGGELLGNVALGWIADRVGHRVVVMAGVAAMLGANLTALLAPSPDVLSAAFALWGVQVAAVHVSNLNILLEFAPDPEDRPTYIGLGTTILVPVAFGSPLAAGALADALGFRTVFGISIVCGLLSLLVLARCVRDPRRA
jgi:MFS family permease